MRIDLIIGPMFAGKSSELIRVIKRYVIMGKKSVVINTVLDTRCEQVVQTHDNSTYAAIKYSKLMDFYNTEDYRNAEVIGIDEAQFFDDLIEFVELAEKDRKSMVISGLNGNIDRKPMGQIPQIIGMVDSIKLLTAVSTRGNTEEEAIFSIREVNMDPNKIIPGGKELYSAVTREEYLKFKENNDK